MAPFTRRQFIKRGAAAAAAAALPWSRVLPGTGVSYAAGPGDAIVVFIQLNGGNDGLNTVYPLGGSQRSNYDLYRPTLALPDTQAGLTSWAGEGFSVSDVLDIGVNDDGTSYALHPVMGAMQGLYQQGDLAVINGVRYPFANHSHFRSEDIWYNLDPVGTGNGGWFGSYLDWAGFIGADVPCLNMGSSVNPAFSPTDTSVLAIKKLSELDFPASGEKSFKKDTVVDLYAASGLADPALYPELVSMGNTGAATINKMEEYYLPGNGLGNAGKVEALMLSSSGKYNRNNPLVYDSALNSDVNPEVAYGGGLARDLRHVAATIRSDVGARFFHVQTGGFDTHASQENGFFHSYLLKKVSESLVGFYQDMNTAVTMPSGYTGYLEGSLIDKVLIVVWSEFGRTIRQNAYGAGSAGTDHATSAPVFVAGGSTIGGQYGVYPQLDNPGVENEDDLRMIYDFRDVFGTVMENWLNVPAAQLVPGGALLPSTAATDPEGDSYTAYNSIGFL